MRRRLSDLPTRARNRVRYIKAGLSPNVRVAATEAIHNAALADEPRLRNMIDVSLQEKLAAEQPLRWRIDDAKWYARNAVLSLRGKARTPYPWTYPVDVEVRSDHQDLFVRDQSIVVAEKRRVRA